MIDNEEKIEAFDAHRNVYKVMLWTGFYKLHSPNRYHEQLHTIYRAGVIVFIGVYNVQHIIYTYNSIFHDQNMQLEGIIEEISHFNLFGKLIALTINSSKLDALHDVIKSPVFAAETKKDNEFLKKNKAAVSKLFSLTFVWVTFSFIAWSLNMVFKRIEDPANVVPSYFPFRTDSVGRYVITLLMEIVPVFWVGYGHFGIDCMTASYYSQATYQIKLLKYKLEHMFDDEDATVRGAIPFRFKDELDPTLNERFIKYVKRYGAIAWYVEEVNSALNLGISLNFLTLSVTLCLVVYNIQLLNVFSVAFMFMFALLLIYQAQNFLYCYYGHLVQYESDTVNTAIYFSDWLSVSPKFRRQMLIVMSRWQYRLIPTVSSVVPVSLTTFVAIIRLAYTMYTVMKTY